MANPRRFIAWGRLGVPTRWPKGTRAVTAGVAKRAGLFVRHCTVLEWSNKSRPANRCDLAQTHRRVLSGPTRRLQRQVA